MRGSQSLIDLSTAGQIHRCGTLSPPGVEHHLQQLADLCLAGVVLRDLDDARPAPVRHDIRPFPGHLRHRSGGAGLPQRAASESLRAVPGSAPCCDRGL